MKIYFLPREPHWEGEVACSSRWPTDNELKDMFWSSFSYKVLSRILLFFSHFKFYLSIFALFCLHNRHFVYILRHSVLYFYRIPTYTNKWVSVSKMSITFSCHLCWALHLLCICFYAIAMCLVLFYLIVSYYIVIILWMLACFHFLFLLLLTIDYFLIHYILITASLSLLLSVPTYLSSYQYPFLLCVPLKKMRLLRDNKA